MKRWLTIFCMVALTAGCGGAKLEVDTGGEAKESKKGKLGKISSGSTRCKTAGHRESLVDLNQDEEADVLKVYKKTNEGEVLICREADLNFDGTKDIFMFFGDSGQIARDEVDLDYDKKVDIISTYAKGQVIKQEIDTNSDGLIDRVRFLEQGLPVRVEGDTDGDRKVDYWEYYEAGNLVRIGIDNDGDGRADSWSRDSETEAAALQEGKEEESEEGEEESEESEEKEEAKKPEKSKAD